MVKANREKSFLESLSELRPTGRGYSIVQAGYDSTQDRHDGIVEFVPPGLEVKYLGEGSIAPNYDHPFGEFLVYDPSKIEVAVKIIEGRDETPAVEKAYQLKSEGYSGEIRPYHRHFTVWGQRPALIRAEATSTS